MARFEMEIWWCALSPSNTAELLLSKRRKTRSQENDVEDDRCKSIFSYEQGSTLWTMRNHGPFESVSIPKDPRCRWTQKSSGWTHHSPNRGSPKYLHCEYGRRKYLHLAPMETFAGERCRGTDIGGVFVLPLDLSTEGLPGFGVVLSCLADSGVAQELVMLLFGRRGMGIKVELIGLI